MGCEKSARNVAIKNRAELCFLQVASNPNFVVLRLEAAFHFGNGWRSMADLAGAVSGGFALSADIG